MDKFEEYVKNSSDKFETNVEGCFDCQVCDELVQTAYHDRTTGLLVWKCSEGHTSHIKDFNV